MKVCVIQPKYSFDEKENDLRCKDLLSLLDLCDESTDIIVLPEYSDALADVKGKQGFYEASARNKKALLNKAKQTAKRCGALVFVNCAFETEKGLRNTTYAIDRSGNIAGKYFKAHPAPSEVKTDSEGGHELDVDYSYEYRKPYVLELDGLRFAFMTCYDFYFYENFAKIAKENVDIIIGCALQRTDSHETISTINKFLCYNTNAYLIRASVSLSENSPACGSSQVVSPEGKILLDMKNDVGLGVTKINPADKYYKPAGYMGIPKSHYEYIEEGRRPWLYRNGGASVVRFEDIMPYPRVCAYRGFNTVAPENSMAAFGSAVALGADEIGLDVRLTKDGILVVCSQDDIKRISDGDGKISEQTYSQLSRYDFGIKFDDKFARIRITAFSKVLQKFASRTIMNVRLKISDNKNDETMIKQALSLVKEYDCENHVYFTSNNDDFIKKIKRYAPKIHVCLEDDGENSDMLSVIKRAINLNVSKIQISAANFNAEAIKEAHEHDIRCNLIYTDNPDDARKYIEKGADTVITNNFLPVYNAVKDLLHKNK